MTKQLLTMLLFAASFSGYSQAKQESQKPETFEGMYYKLKEMHLQMLNSRSHKIADSLYQVFTYKITPDLSILEINKESKDHLSWAKANLSKTEFKDVAEAEKLWAEYEAANMASVLDNKEYTEYMLEVIQTDGGVEVYTNATTDVYLENRKQLYRIKLPKRAKKSDFYPKLPGQ